MADTERTVRVKFDGDARGVKRAARQGEDALEKFSRATRTAGADFGLGGFANGLAALAAAPALLTALIPVAAFVGATAGALLVAGFGTAVAGLGLVMAAQSDRVKTAFSGMTSRITAELKRISAPFEDTLISISGFIERSFGKFAPELERANKKLAPAITRFSDHLFSAFDRLAPAIQPMIDAFIVVLDRIGPRLPAIFDRIAAALINVANAIAAHPDALANIVTFLGLMLAGIINIIPWLTNLADKLHFESVVAGVGLVATKLGELWTQVTDGIRKWVADNRASIDQFVANLRTAFDNLTGAVVAIIDFLKAAWANGGQEMLTIVFNTINNIVNIIAGALQIIQGIFQVATGALTGNWSLLWDGLRNIAAGAGRLLANAIDAVMRIIVAQWGGNWDQIKATTSAKLAQMVGAVSSGLATIASFFGSLPGRILGAVGNLGGLLVGAGRAVIQGFLNGINSMIGAVTAKLRQLTSMIPQLKGPPSRDARLLYSNGQRIMDGLLAGFSSRIPAVDATLSRITNVVIPGAATAPGPAAMATTAAATPAVIDVHVHVGDEVVRTVRTVLDDINRGVRRRITAGTGQGI